MPGLRLPLREPLALPFRMDRGLSPIVDTGGGWWKPGASLDLDFANNRIFGAASFASALAITRASAGYAQNAAGVWTPFASGALRITDKGILIEEARTNSIRNNSMQEAVAGTPGTLPTNTFGGTLAGLTRTLGSPTTENGIDVLDYSFVGTATGAIDIQFESSSQIAAAAAQTWVSSLFLKLASGSLTNISSIQLSISEWDSTGSVFKAVTLTTLPSPTGVLTRFRTNRTLTDATTARVTTTLRINVAGAVNFTLRIGWPQLELGAFATSPIRTTSAAATRAADQITLNNPTNFANLNAMSNYVEWLEGIGGPSANTRMFYDIGTIAGGDQMIGRITSGSGKPMVEMVSGSATQGQLLASGEVPSVGSIYKQSARFKLNDMLMRCTSSLSGNLADTVATMPTGSIERIGIGCSRALNNQLNGYLRRLALFPTAQTDAQLEALVA